MKSRFTDETFKVIHSFEIKFQKLLLIPLFFSLVSFFRQWVSVSFRLREMSVHFSVKISESVEIDSFDYPDDDVFETKSVPTSPRQKVQLKRLMSRLKFWGKIVEIVFDDELLITGMKSLKDYCSLKFLTRFDSIEVL